MNSDHLLVSGIIYFFLLFLDLLRISLLLIGAVLASISTTFVNFAIVIGLSLCWSVICTVYHLDFNIIRFANKKYAAKFLLKVGALLVFYFAVIVNL